MVLTITCVCVLVLVLAAYWYLDVRCERCHSVKTFQIEYPKSTLKYCTHCGHKETRRHG